jgi:hypothetical protein
MRKLSIVSICVIALGLVLGMTWFRVDGRTVTSNVAQADETPKAPDNIPAPEGWLDNQEAPEEMTCSSYDNKCTSKNYLASCGTNGRCTSSGCCCPLARQCRSGSFPYCCPSGTTCKSLPGGGMGCK